MGNVNGNRGRKVSLSPLWCASVYTRLLFSCSLALEFWAKLRWKHKEIRVSCMVSLSISNVSVVILPFLVQNRAGNLETVH